MPGVGEAAREPLGLGAAGTGGTALVGERRLRAGQRGKGAEGLAS